jgi:hypothetical protein
MTEATRDRIVRALTAEESALRDEGVSLIVDHVLGQKIRELVDLEASRAIVVRALTEENLARIVGQHLRPAWRRYAEHVEDSEETLGGFVPEPSREKIRAIVGRSKLPRGKWAQGIVDPALMRRLFAPVWANLLLNFAKRLPVPGMGGPSGAAAAASGAVGRGVGGIAGRLTRSVQERAEKIVDAGRTAMGGLGAEVEKRLQAAAREFSDGAADMWREALQDRLKSTEGRELVSQITRQVVDHLMMTKLSDLHEDAARLPIEDMIDLAPAIVGHSAPRAFVQELVSGELSAFLAVEGDRPLGELLLEMGILEPVRAATIREIGRIARGLFGSPAFGSWVGRLLEA